MPIHVVILNFGYTCCICLACLFLCHSFSVYYTEHEPKNKKKIVGEAWEKGYHMSLAIQKFACTDWGG